MHYVHYMPVGFIDFGKGTIWGQDGNTPDDIHRNGFLGTRHSESEPTLSQIIRASDRYLAGLAEHQSASFINRGVTSTSGYWAALFLSELWCFTSQEPELDRKELYAWCETQDAWQRRFLSAPNFKQFPGVSKCYRLMSGLVIELDI